ncbi:MAG: beta-ketoacyl-ACP synthase II [Chlamydiota bacterium]|nr:beta-ketoacyl-ACP synthase II [Chlamydiota bacterium]
MAKRRIVVTGMGVVSCFGNDIETFYDSLLNGKSGVRPIESFPCEEYTTRFAAPIPFLNTDGYIDPKQARRIDPYIAYAMIAGKKSLESSNLIGESLSSLNKKRCGIIIGSGMGGMSIFCEGTHTLENKGFKRVSPFFVPYIITNMGSALLAIDVGFSGPNYSISTACATANYSIMAAAQHIAHGEADLMLCGGSEAAIIPMGMSGFMVMKALSRRNEAPEKASRPWDRSRDGFVMGEGAGVLTLESLEHAQARGAPILAEYLGGGISTDAYHMTSPWPDGRGCGEAMSKALEQAGIPKENIDYVNAHATSTPVGDLCEIEGMKKVFGEHTAHIVINSTKSMIGHALGAAGGLEAVVTIQALGRQELHPNMNLEDPEESLSDFKVVGEKREGHRVNYAMSNSFGFGGHNSSIIFSKFMER